MKPLQKLLFRVKIQQVLIISAAWTVISMLISLHETFIFDYRIEDLVINKPDHYSLSKHIFYNLAVSVFGSLVGASMLVFGIGNKFNRTSYGRMIFLYSLIYTLVILLISTITGFTFSAIYYKTSILDPLVIDNVVQFFTSFMLIRVVVIWYLLTAFTVFLLQVNKKYGPWVLYKLVIGKYHKPRTEQRIFMFLDLRSSTTIAEKIGHNAYFRFLKRLYEIITYPILSYHGEIYQYVGDEVVITWTEKSGVVHARCISCFFAIVQAVSKHLEEFKKTYDLTPAFWAGIHTGQVTAGEVGIIKKDIVYTGDVMNTTARIVGHCRKEQVNLIISEPLSQKLPQDIPYSFRNLGMVQLKGKIEFLRLFEVREKVVDNMLTVSKEMTV